MGKGLFDKFPHRMSLPSGQHIIIGGVILEHHPHALDIVTRMPPITFRVDVTKIEAFIKSLADARNCDGDLTRDEGGTTTGRLVVEENAVGQVHTVGFTVVNQNPEGVLLRDSIGRTGVEGCSFGLGDLLNLSVQFGGGSLVETGRLFESTGTDSIKHAKNTNAVTVSSVLRH